MEKPIKDFDNDELVSLTGSGMPVRQAQAQAELTRRLINALADSKKSSDKYNKILVFLTSVMFLVAFAQLVLYSATLPGFSEWARIIGTLMVAGGIFGAGYFIFKLTL